MSKPIEEKITEQEILDIGVVMAGISDGYWQHLAVAEIKKVYIQGMIDMLRSIHRSQNVPNFGLKMKYLQQKSDEIVR